MNMAKREMGEPNLKMVSYEVKKLPGGTASPLESLLIIVVVK